MTRMVALFALGFALLMPQSIAAAGAGASGTTAGDSKPTYLLRYKFQPSQTLRWKVVHRALVNTTVSGTSQTAETTSTSVKVWKALPPDEKGHFRFEHSVEKVEMRQKLTGREEIVYNSDSGEKPPVGFEEAAQSVGIPLAIITIDAQGNVIDRQQKRPTTNENQSQVVVPLPADAVPVGYTWSFPYDIQLPLRNGEVKTIKTRQHFELVDVDHDVATIEIETQVLSPIDSPELEAQLIQRESQGTVKFDIAAGCIVSQEMELDKSVIGFSGDASSLHYVMRFQEELLPAEKTAGPEPPPGFSASKLKTPPRRPAVGRTAPNRNMRR